MGMKAVPYQSLGTDGEPVFIPVPATLFGLNLDYEPLRFNAPQPSPPWLHLHPDKGQLTLEADAPNFITEPVTITVALAHAEGVVGEATTTITPEKTSGLSTPWARTTTSIAERFTACAETMQSSARAIMVGHFVEVY